MEVPLYLHIPFCKKKCAYCDFYSIEYREKLALEYIKTLVTQLRALKEKGFFFPTIYLGGGTPSLLEEGLLEMLLKELREERLEQEITLEANPESLNKDKLKFLFKRGVNRLSLGIQSLNEVCLKFLGRLHNKEQALASLFLAKDAGFKNINVDLIYGIPGSNFELFKEELNQIVELPITHLSLYSLSYEEATPLYERLRRGEFKPVSEEEQARMYTWAIRFLEKKGFRHYEVSNFSRKGYFCRHNLSYWENTSYLGLGPSAVSYINGERRKYLPDVFKYIGARDIFREELFLERERLSPLKRAEETWVLNLRRRKGINFKKFKERTGFPLWKLKGSTIEKLREEKLLGYKKRGRKIYGLRLTRKGFLFADYVVREFL